MASSDGPGPEDLGGSSVPLTPRSAMRLRNSRPPPVIDPQLRDLGPDQVRPRSPESLHGGRSSSPSPGEPAIQPSVQTSLVAFANALATSKKRKAEHKAELVKFAKMSDGERAVWAADIMLDIRDAIGQQEQAEALSFTLPPSVKNNTKKYTIALLLSGSVPNYMLKMDDVLKILSDNGVYPRDWGVKPHCLNTLRTHIQDSATNERCFMKDRVKDSIKDQLCLDALCQAVIAKSGIMVTPSFRARMAFVRFTHANNPRRLGNDFWQFVDTEMRDLRTSANGNASTLQYYLNGYVEQDEKLYTVGNKETYVVISQENELPEFQRIVATAAAAIIPLVPAAGSSATA